MGHENFRFSNPNPRQFGFAGGNDNHPEDRFKVAGYRFPRLDFRPPILGFLTAHPCPLGIRHLPWACYTPECPPGLRTGQDGLDGSPIGTKYDCYETVLIR